MELTEKQKDVALFNYWKADDCAAGECRANSLYAAVEAVLALERPSATEAAMKCRSCDTTTDKTPPFAACGICGAQLVDKVATEPAAQDEALVEKLEQVLRESFDCASFRTIAKDIIAVARQHFAAHPVTAQVPEGYVRLEDVRAALLSVCGESCYWSSVVEKALDRLAPKQKTPEERVQIVPDLDTNDCYDVRLDGKNLHVFAGMEHANRYAAGLRAELAGGSHE